GKSKGTRAPANITTTGGLVGLLRKGGVQHPWLDGAEKFCWSVLEGTELVSQYAAHNAVALLWNIPDDDRVTAARQRLLDDLGAGRIVPVDPAKAESEGDTHTPLHFATTPDSPCRAAFDDATIELFLDRLAAQQQDDG